MSFISLFISESLFIGALYTILLTGTNFSATFVFWFRASARKSVFTVKY